MAEAVANDAPAEVPTQEVEKPKERIKRPTRPDDAKHKAAVDALQAVITKNKARVEAIKAELDARRAGRGASSGQQALKTKLAELRGQFQTVLKRKQHLRAQLEVASKTREAVRASMRDLKANMKFSTVAEIDDAIVKLEHRVQHSSLTLNEEKKILDDIRKLKASRSAVGEYSEKLEALAQDDSARGELQGGLKALDEELNKIKAEEEVLRGELAALREAEAEAGSDVPAMLAEREEAREVCKQAYEKIKDMRAAHDVVWQEFKDADKVWKAQVAEERAARREEMAAERAARDAARAARAAEMAPEPFDKEITTCEQLAAYLGRFIAATAAPTAAAQEEAAAVADLEGMKPFARKADDQDAWMTGAGAGKKGKKGAKKGGAAPAPGPAKISHSLDMLEAFATLSIAVPTSSAAMAASVSEVEAKKVEFLAKREEAKAAKEKAAAEGGDAAAAAPAEANGAGEEAEEGEIVEEASSSAGAAPADKGAKGKKGGKKGAAQAPPKLDDAESWPAMGGDTDAPAPAPAVDPSRPSAADVAKGVASAGGVAVGIKVADGGDGVSLSIDHDDEE